MRPAALPLAVMLGWCGGAETLAQEPAAPQATPIGLYDYVVTAVRESDAARDLQDARFLRQFDLELAQSRFDTELVPLTNILIGDDTGAQTVGFEARRNTESGATLAAGIASDKFTSDNFDVTNPYQTRAYVRLSQGLFRRWGERYNRAPLTQAEILQRKEGFIAEVKRQGLIFDAVRRYYDVLLNRKLLRQTERSLERREHHLAAARARHSVGLVSKVDVYQAELAKLAAEVSLKDQMRALRRSVEELHELVALEQVGTLSPDDAIVRLIPLIPNDWQERLLDNRGEWHAHLMDLRSTDLSLYRAERDTQPDISLNLTLAQEGLGGSFDESAKLDETEWTLQLQLRSTLSMGEEKAALARERVLYTKARREGRAVRRKIQRDAREALSELGAEERRHRIAVERLRQAEAAVELAAVRYSRGLSSNLDVLDAEAQLAQAQIDIWRSLVAFNVAAVRVGQAFGILDLAWLEATLRPDPVPSNATPSRSSGQRRPGIPNR